jgi:ABC-2 type transport system permease protein
MSASISRIAALVLRYVYLFRSSWARVAELAYWPILQMITWGFITQFFQSHSTWVATASGVLLGGVMLWDVLFRGQIGLSISFLEEMWSRNLGHLFVSPLRPYELIAALMTMSLLRTLIGAVPAAFLAWVFYDFSVLSIGLPLLAFFLCLMVMSWAMGLLAVSLVLRAGLGAEGLAWVMVFMLVPISAVYYPVSILPEWLQVIAWMTPSAHVFEGMRAVMFEGVFRTDLFLGAVIADGVYLAIGIAAFTWSFGAARAENRLLQMGE